MEWTKSLIEQVKNTSEDHDLCNLGEVEENEIVIGTLPVELRKFLTLALQEVRELSEETDEHIRQHENPEHSHIDCTSFHERQELKQKRIENINLIFWSEVNHFVETNFQITRASLAIREDWKIIQIQNPETSFVDVLRSLDSIMMQIG